jgi:glutaminase
LVLNGRGLPHNPMINSGAIMSCSLLKPTEEMADRFEHVLDTWTKLSGGIQAQFNNSVYLSERQTADRNFALGYFMKENGAFPDGTDLLNTLEFYFQSCSVEVNADAMAIAASTLANGGVCPLTGKRVFSSDTVKDCLSLMSSCGMYDFSGEFAFTIGLPAKSGVAGGLMVVVPNLFGLCIWSPRLDELGNSVRGIAFCKELVKTFNFHLYDSLTVGSHQKKDPRLQKNASKIDNIISLCWAASQGDLMEVKHLVAKGVDVDDSDYDGRTALHLAASEGHESIVKYLLKRKANVTPLDRWGNTPLDDAKRHHHDHITKLFLEYQSLN